MKKAHAVLSKRVPTTQSTQRGWRITSGSIVSAAMSHLELLDQYLTPDAFDFRVQFMSESGARTAGYAMLRCINRGRRMEVLVSCSTIIVQSAPL